MVICFPSHIPTSYPYQRDDCCHLLSFGCLFLMFIFTYLLMYCVTTYYFIPVILCCLLTRVEEDLVPFSPSLPPSLLKIYPHPPVELNCNLSCVRDQHLHVYGRYSSIETIFFPEVLAVILLFSCFQFLKVFIQFCSSVVINSLLRSPGFIPDPSIHSRSSVLGNVYLSRLPLYHNISFPIFMTGFALF